MLNDTEYIFKDLLRWHLKKKLGIKLEDAVYEDILFLFNSYELKDCFKQTSALKISAGFVNDFGINLSDSISFDLAYRTTKNSLADTYAVQIPDKILVSIYRIKTIEDYMSILGELGKSLFFSSINIDETFENKRLIDPVILETFKILFADFVFEQKWLGRYLTIDADKNFIHFLYLKKLFILRSLCVNVLLYSSIYLDKLDESLQEISDIYMQNIFVKPNENQILFDLILGDTKPCISYRACLYESYLKEYLKNNFDEQWWRDEESGRQLVKWWDRCSDLTSAKIEEEIGTEGINNSKLTSTFENVYK